MEELFSSYKQFIKDRFSTPFFANFVFAWCIYNWKAVYTTIFLEPQVLYPQNKIDYILGLYVDNNDLLLKKPLLLAIGVTLVFPLLNILVFGYRELFRRFKKWLGVQINKTGTISSEEYWKLSEELRKTEERYQKAINTHGHNLGEINTLKIQLNTSRDDNAQASKDILKLTQEASANKSHIQDLNQNIEILNASLKTYSISAISNIRYKIVYDETDQEASIQIKDNMFYINEMHYGRIDLMYHNKNIIAFRVLTIGSRGFLMFDLIYDEPTKSYKGWVYDSSLKEGRSCTLIRE